MKNDDLKAMAVDIRRGQGDAIEGDRVIAHARSIKQPKATTGTSSHRIQETILKTNVFCVIDKQFRIVRST